MKFYENFHLPYLYYKIKLFIINFLKVCIYMKLIRQVNLYLKKGTTDKVYEIDLCEVGKDKFVVNFRFGKRGTKLRNGTKTILPVSEKKAEQVFDKLVESKLRKGYRSEAAYKPYPETETPSPVMPENIDSLTNTENGLDPRSVAVLNRLIKMARLVNTGGYTIDKSVDGWTFTRAVWRAGELSIKEAEPYLLENLGKFGELSDYCILWSLGNCTKNRDKVLVKAETIYKDESKPSSVRRIASELILKLCNDDELRKYTDKFKSSLPHNLKTASENYNRFADALKNYLKTADYKSYNILFTLYQINTGIYRQALIETIRNAPLKPNYFRQIRHIFKASEFRRDGEMFGLIAFLFETRASRFNLSSYSHYMFVGGRYIKKSDLKEALKADDSNYAFSLGTRDYFRRRVWRTLYRLGDAGDKDYVKMACGVLAPITDRIGGKAYTSSFTRWFRVPRENGGYRYDRETYTRYFPKYASYIAFNQILYRNSDRLYHKGNSWRFKDGMNPKNNPLTTREEAFPELWDKEYKQLIGLVSVNQCLKVHEFIYYALKDNKQFIDNIETKDIITLLNSPFEITGMLGFSLLNKVLDPNNPDLELIKGMVNCAYKQARDKAFELLSSNTELLINNKDLIYSIITSYYKDTRLFLIEALKPNAIPKDISEEIFARLVSYIIMNESPNAVEKFSEGKLDDITSVLLAVFPDQCKKLGSDVIYDLVNLKSEKVQEFVANILLQHDVYSTNPPEELIQKLITSKYDTVRGLGVQLFGQLPDEVLMGKQQALIELLKHNEVSIRDAVRPVIARLVTKDMDFAISMANLIFDKLFRMKNEEILNFLSTVIREDFVNVVQLPKEAIFKLLKSRSTSIQELGGFFLNRYDGLDTLSLEDIIELSNNDVRLVREISWRLCEKHITKLKQNTEYAIKILDSKWDDTREFAFNFITNNFSDKDFTPPALVSICDSTLYEVQEFGRSLITKYFEDKDGVEYLLKLSEHPSGEIQMFVTNYLDRYATNSPERIEKLAEYFKRALSRVNKGRVAKKRILMFLEKEALKDQVTAKVITDIMAFISPTIAISYKSEALKIMLKIKRKYPDIDTPITIKEVEVRNAV